MQGILFSDAIAAFQQAPRSLVGASWLRYNGILMSVMSVVETFLSDTDIQEMQAQKSRELSWDGYFICNPEAFWIASLKSCVQRLLLFG
jgi:hypothetical protein